MLSCHGASEHEEMLLSFVEELMLQSRPSSYATDAV
jgi:hypothetical protein